MYISYEDFEKDFMVHFSGYAPIYCYFCDDSNNPEKHHAVIEVIAPWRMSDGPSRFYRQYEITVTDEQKSKLGDYIKRAGEWWKDKLDDQAKNFYPASV